MIWMMCPQSARMMNFWEEVKVAKGIEFTVYQFTSLPMSSRQKGKTNSFNLVRWILTLSLYVLGILLEKSCFLNIFSPQKATWPVSSPEKVWQPSHGRWRLWTGRTAVFACICMYLTQSVWDNMYLSCLCDFFFCGFARWTLRELFEILRDLEARIRYSAKTAIGFIRFPLG